MKRFLRATLLAMVASLAVSCVDTSNECGLYQHCCVTAFYEEDDPSSTMGCQGYPLDEFGFPMEPTEEDLQSCKNSREILVWSWSVTTDKEMPEECAEGISEEPAPE